jgi:hypothetical protein
MNAQDTLNVISICSATVGFISGVGSQLWKSSVEVDGRITKRLTRAGWALAAISLIGFSGTAASELLRINVRHNEELQAKTKAEQEQLLREQETRWRDEMQRMLAATKADIETNIDNTLKGFQQSQTQIAESKQSVLEASLRHTNEIVVASQPLTSLSFHWQFASRNAKLWQVMKDGIKKVRENAEDEQGGVPLVPYDVMDYDAVILPLMSNLVRISKGADANNTQSEDIQRSTFIVLVALDEAANAILSFGAIGSQTSWYEKRDGVPISAGFIKMERKDRRKGNSIPAFTAELAPSESGQSTYHLAWTLDPFTLWNSIDRRNSAIIPTAKLPQTLRVTILHNARVLPFAQNNFAAALSNVWGNNKWARESIDIDKGELADMVIRLEVNELQEKKYSYSLKQVYKLRLTDDFDDDIDTGCTVFEFEPT